tara:strand:+ start:402 stop:866 length:465 start_codon:yes stop_codon:yes gene_type:complete
MREAFGPPFFVMGLNKSKNRRVALVTADQWFSRYIRLRDADKAGNCECVTCGTTKPYTSMDAGHFMSRRYLSTRFHEQNVHAQCVKCNQYGAGEQYIHGIRIRQKYGDQVLEEIIQQKERLTKYSKEELMSMAREYKKKYEHECRKKDIERIYK